jgi:hypothetical protein
MSPGRDERTHGVSPPLEVRKQVGWASARAGVFNTPDRIAEASEVTRHKRQARTATLDCHLSPITCHLSAPLLDRMAQPNIRRAKPRKADKSGDIGIP